MRLLIFSFTDGQNCNAFKGIQNKTAIINTAKRSEGCCMRFCMGRLIAGRREAPTAYLSISRMTPVFRKVFSFRRLSADNMRRKVQIDWLR